MADQAVAPSPNGRQPKAGDSGPTSNNNGSNSDTNPVTKRKPINACWTHITEGILHKSIRRFVVALASHSVRYPMATVVGITLLSFALVAVGFFTNFRMELDQMAFLTPQGSLPDQHSDWIKEGENGFEKLRVLWLALHSDGENVVHVQAMRQAITVMDMIKTQIPEFQTVCAQSQYLDFDTNEPTCRIFSVTQYWNENITFFEEQVKNQPLLDTPEYQDEYIRRAISNPFYPDGTPVFHEAILGNYENTTVYHFGNAVFSDDFDNDDDDDDGMINVNSNETAFRNETASSSTSSSSSDTLPNNNNNHNSNGNFYYYYDGNQDTQVYHLRQSPSQQKQPPQDWIIPSAQTLVIKIDIPDLGDVTDDLELILLDRLADMKKSWSDDSTTTEVELEYFTFNAYQAEFQRAIDQDLPLVVVLIVIMISFVCFVFWRPKEKVKSRAMLGGFAFATIGCSLLTGYGIMFLAGVPLTNIGIMIPFVVVGIALDDTFIITGAYFRIKRDDPNGDILTIIQETMDEVAVSISMTTITTLICFCAGIASTIPAVKWLCLYAATTIGVDFLYQITYFIAFMTLDERRVQANRRDMCFWIVVGDEDDEDDEDESEADERAIEAVQTGITESASEGSVNGDLTPLKRKSQQMPASQRHFEEERSLAERCMTWYADKLLKPWVKVFVIVAFSAYFAGCTYSTTLLYQEFNVGDYVPEDSYLTSFMTVFQQYTTVQRYIGVYFRNVDQADPDIQQQMSQYVQDLSDLPQIGEDPAFFWVRDFPQLATSQQATELGLDVTGLANLTFNEQIEFALNIPQIRQIYAQDIVRDKNSGNITASRTYLNLRHINMYEVTNQVDMLMDQRRITEAQLLNSAEYTGANNGDLAFFTFDDLYYFWELYAIVVDELIFTTVTCVSVVSVISFIMIPHWTAVAFVTPLIIVLYFCLMGTMQFCGIKINSVTYFIIVMAIGLLVDFLMHMLLRYYETKGRTRHEKVKETLETMGSSILLGGFTTWLGVVPLAFSTTKIFMTVFISFWAMIILGIAVGLILLPVLLSMFGPVDPEESYNSVKTYSISSVAVQEALTTSPNSNLADIETEKAESGDMNEVIVTAKGSLNRLLRGDGSISGTIPLTYNSKKVLLSVSVSAGAAVAMGTAVGLVLLPALLYMATSTDKAPSETDSEVPSVTSSEDGEEITEEVFV